MKNVSIQDLTKMAVCVAIICVSAYLSFPIPFTTVPFSCLTLAMLLAAFLLTPKQTFIVIVVYTLIGAIGLPVFAGGASGIGVLFSPAGGYLWGFIVAFPISSMLKGKDNKFSRYFLAGLVSIPITYLFGVAMLAYTMKLGIMQAIVVGALPFIPGDIVKAAIASYVAIRLRKVLAYV